MNETNELDLMLNALTEIIQEEKAKQTTAQTPPTPDLPNLNAVFARITPLPEEALFLGMANDGLPVLLNLQDPVPGPLLIAGDGATGKTRLLKTIARGAELLHSPEAVKYCIISTKPDEWQDFYKSENNLGIYKADEENSTKLLRSLAEWAHNNKGEGQYVLLLLDDLEALTQLDQQTQQHLRWLLLRGPSRRVWTFATFDSQKTETQQEWLEFFHTRLFGCIRSPENAKRLSGNTTLSHLTAGEEFAMRDGNDLLKFLLPNID